MATTYNSTKTMCSNNPPPQLCPSPHFKWWWWLVLALAVLLLIAGVITIGVIMWDRRKKQNRDK